MMQLDTFLVENGQKNAKFQPFFGMGQPHQDKKRSNLIYIFSRKCLPQKHNSELCLSSPKLLFQNQSIILLSFSGLLQNLKIYSSAYFYRF